jgi:flagellar motility protein MotE (MotC chaperone)
MKRLYHILALMALVNLFAVLGFVGFLVASGRLDAERAEQIAKVLRGEWPQPVGDAPATQPAAPAPPPQPSQAEIARAQAQREYYALLADRHQQELDQRSALNSQLQLDVTRKLEELEAKRKAFEEERQRTFQQAEMVGFARELEMFEKMDAKKSKELLMGRKDPDVVQLLMKMESNRARKILDACKTEAELAWAGRILTQIHNLNGDTASGVDGPTASQ